MTIKEQNNYNDNQSIREISIKFMSDMLGKDQAIRLITDISSRNKACIELANSTIKEIERLS